MVTTPTDLSAQIADYVAKVAVRDGLFYEWMTGSATGGVNGDGVYPLTDLSGFTRYLESPAKIMGQATSGFATRVRTKANLESLAPNLYIPGSLVLVYADPNTANNGPYVRVANPDGWQYAQWFYDSLSQKGAIDAIQQGLEAEAARVDRMVGYRVTAPTLVACGADHHAAFVVTATGHIHRNMTAEPARHGAGRSALVLADASGHAALTIDRDGALRRDMRAEPARHGRGAFPRLTLDARGYALDAVRTDPRTGLAEPVPIGGAINAFDMELAIVSIYGQSNSLGYYSTPVVTGAPFSDRLLRFAGGVRPQDFGDQPNDLTSTLALCETIGGDLGSGPVRAGETPASGAGLAMLDTLSSWLDVSLQDLDMRVLFHAAGQGSTASAGLARGTVPYTRLTNEMRAAVALARRDRRTVGVPFMIRVQGEQDIADRVSPDLYEAQVLKELRDYERDVFAATGVMRPIVLVHAQTATWPLLGRGPEIALRQAEMADRNPFVLLACPMYPLTHQTLANDPSGLHLTAVSAKVLGAYASRAYVQSLGEDENGRLVYDPASRFRGVGPIDVHRVGLDAIEASFRVPVAPLVFDTTIVSDPGNYGFAVVRPGVGTLAIDVPVIHGRNRVRIGVPGGIRPGDRLTYALSPTGGEAGPRTGARGCLADSETYVLDPAGVNRRLRNYCEQFSRPIRF